MIWVESAGGPLLVVEQTALLDWAGAEEDYERACAVDDVVGAIRVGDAAQALVMGDEPAGTTFIPALGVFVRWLYGEDGTDVVAAVEASLPTAEWDASALFDVSGPLVLFDASCPGADVVIEETDSPDQQATEYARTENGLRVTVPRGRYVVESADVKPDQSSCLRLHRLTSV